MGIAIAIPLGSYALTTYKSIQVGNNPTNGYVLQTNGTDSTWVATSSLGISGGGGGGSSTIWGNITGTLSNQTDLQDALDRKVNTVSSTDMGVARFSGTDGQLQDTSEVTIDNAGNLSIVPSNNTLPDYPSSNGVYAGQRVSDSDASLSIVSGLPKLFLGHPGSSPSSYISDSAGVMTFYGAASAQPVFKVGNIVSILDESIQQPFSFNAANLTNSRVGTFQDKDGTFAYLSDIPSSTPATPGGPDLSVQINEGGVLAGYAGLTFNSSTNVLSVTNVSSSAVTSSVLASTPSQPFLVSTLTSSTIMAQSYSVFVSGNYAYMVSLVGDSLTIIDVSNQATPKIIGVLTDASNLNGARNVYVAGKYAYVANQDDNSLAIVDVSNPSAPVLTGKVKDNSLLNRAYFVNVAGQYAYVIANADNSMRVIDISSSTNPQIIGGIKDNTNLAGAYGMNVNGRYAYVVAGTDNSLRVIDLINPTSPVIVGGIKNNSLLTAARAVYVSGRYAYVTAFNTSTLAIIDVSNPATTTPIVGYLRDTVNLNGVRSVTVQDGYAYVGAATNNSVDIIDISSSTNPRLVQVLKDNTNLNIPHGIYVAGNYLYAAMNTTTNPNFSIVGLNGLTAATANLGALKVSSINVQDDGVFNRNVVIQSGLNVGDRGINTSGNFTGFNLMLSGSGTSTNFFASGLMFTTANGTSVTTTNLSFGVANGTSVTTTNLNWSTGVGTSLTLTNGTSTNFFSGGLTFTNLFGTNATTTNLSLSGAFSQTGLGDCSGANQALNYTLSNGEFGCFTVTGGTSTGTVTLTQNQIAFGDPSNAVTSSPLFKFSTSTGLLVSITSTLATTTIGQSITILPSTPLSIGGNTSSYVQVNLQNLSSGALASGDYVVTADNGNDTKFYGDFGVNSSGFADPTFDIAGKNDGYLYMHGGNLAIGTASSTSSIIKFFIGGTVSTTEIARFTTSGLQMWFGKGITTTNMFATTTNFVNATSTNLNVGTRLSFNNATGTNASTSQMYIATALSMGVGNVTAPTQIQLSPAGTNFIFSASSIRTSGASIDIGTTVVPWGKLYVNSVTSTNVTTTNLLAKTLSMSIRSVSTDQTLNPTSTDFTILVDASGANRTINLPNTASTTVGRIFNIKKTDSSGNSVFIDAFASQTIDGNTVRTSTVQYTNVQIQSDGTNWQVL